MPGGSPFDLGNCVAANHRSRSGSRGPDAGPVTTASRRGPYGRMLAPCFPHCCKTPPLLLQVPVFSTPEFWLRSHSCRCWPAPPSAAATPGPRSPCCSGGGGPADANSTAVVAWYEQNFTQIRASRLQRRTVHAMVVPVRLCGPPLGQRLPVWTSTRSESAETEDGHASSRTNLAKASQRRITTHSSRCGRICTCNQGA